MRILTTALAAATLSSMPFSLALCDGTSSPDDDLDGVTVAGGDCDDLDATVYPGAYDAPQDGVDSDCNGHSDYVITVAGTGTPGFGGDTGAATAAQLKNPFQAVSAPDGDVYIADSGNNRIRKVDSATGVITTVAGNGNPTFSGDNGAATAASLNNPKGLAVDSAGNLFICDAGNHRVRRLDAATGTITTVAGNGSQGYAGDGASATAARLNWPYGVAVTATGDLYIADSNNHRIRLVSGGVITTVAGTDTAGFSGDGSAATSAQLNFPRAVALAGSTLYVADTNNYRIRKIAGGTITTVAGSGSDGYSGDGQPATTAKLNDPYAVAVDAGGNVLVGDTDNSRVRMVTGGVIDTVVGTGTASSTGNGVEDGADLATVNLPYGLGVDADGDLLITETSGHQVRYVLW